jgi:hypothetical protein
VSDREYRLNRFLGGSTEPYRLFKQRLRIPAAPYEDLTRAGQFHLLLVTCEDNEADSAFEFSDPLAEGWLSDPKPIRSPRKIELIR